MSTKATAARIYEYGEPDVFRFETMDVPDPVGHLRQILVALNLFPLNQPEVTIADAAPESTSASSTATAWHPLSRGAPA